MIIPRAQRIASSNATPSTPGKQALRLWLRILSCANMLEQHIGNRLRQQFDVTLAQFDVLSELEHAGHPLTMTELSQHLMVSKGNITGMVDRLERDGLVQRQASAQDRRVLYISLTQLGMQRFASMANEHEVWVQDLFAGLDDAQTETLLELLRLTKESIRHHDLGINSDDRQHH